MKSVIVFVVLIYAIVFMPSASATTYYVNGTTGNDLWDGLAAAWDGTHGPKKTIQAGINASSDTDTVIVADGTYKGAGNKNLDFVGRAITVRSQNGPEVCIIDCEGSGRGFSFYLGENVTSVLNGFTITNGSWAVGGGISCNYASSPTIMDCYIYGNSATDEGGGIYCYNASDPTITDCIINGNSADTGGGIYCGLLSNPTITDCTIAENDAVRLGGGMCILGRSEPVLTRCAISFNTAAFAGSGLYWFDSDPTLNECTIAANSGSEGILSYSSNAEITNCSITGNSGCGIYFYYDTATMTNCTISDNSSINAGGICCSAGSPTITSCIISENSATVDGGGILCGTGSNPTITDCEISGNSATVDGGGIFCRESSNPTITDCVITGNSAGDNGGGVYCSASSPTITDCTISDNYAVDLGGGMTFLGDSNPVISRCRIERNSCGSMGGGFYWFDNNPTLSGCTIIENVGNGGGGIFSYSSNATIINCKIIRNSSNGIECRNDSATITNCVISANFGWNGSGVYCTLESNPVITNCTITDNATTGSSGSGIVCGSTSSPTITNCILWGNEDDEIHVAAGGMPTVTYCDVKGAWFGVGNISVDPLLLPLAGGTLRLKHGSPCIDAGTSSPPVRAFDIEGRSRWDDPSTPNTGGGPVSFVDIGAHEFKGWYVNGNPAIGNNAYNGAYPTWLGGLNGPELTIQAGINDAADGDIVTVAPWTYTDAGNVNLNFANGLPAGETRLIALTANDGADTTIIDCEDAARGFNFLTNEDTTAVVNGFTITNGYTGSFGAGIRCEHASPTITHCKITGNNAGSDGGGIDCWNASPDIINCKIIANNANTGYGGGIDCYDSNSSPTIVNCLIVGNTAAASRGGGLSCNGGDPTITNCLIVNNSSATNGGGIWFYNSNATVVNCTFSLNEADGSGGGIYCQLGSPTITDSILWDDLPEEIYVVFGNPVVTYCDVEGGSGQPWFGTGCFVKNPLFVSGPLHDYYLSQISAGQAFNSKCVDAGSALASDLGMQKLGTRTDGGKDEGTVDMGYHALHLLYIYNIERSGNNITIYWKNTPGASYTVQYSSDMAAWHDVPVGETDNWTDIGGAVVSERYYRIKE